MRKNNKIQGISLVLAILLVVQFLCGGQVSAYQVGEYRTIIAGGYHPCMQVGNTSSSIVHYTYLGEDAYYPVYQMNYDQNAICHDITSIIQYEASDEIRKILKAGYPFHSYSELGCTTAYPAYMATQLVLLEYTQGENLAEYRGWDEKGREVEIAIQKIKENLSYDQNLGQIPELYFQEESNWEVYEYDPNYYVKTMKIDSTHSDVIFQVIVPEGKGIRILDQSNSEQIRILYRRKLENSDSKRSI